MVYDAATQALKTVELQKQFICPIWTVWFGKSCNLYFTAHHAEQMTRALRLNETECRAFSGDGIAV